MRRRFTIDLSEEHWKSLEEYAKSEEMSLTKLIDWIVYSYSPPQDMVEDEESDA